MASVRNGGRVRRRRIFACSVAVYFTAISTLITRTRQSVLSCAVVSSPVMQRRLKKLLLCIRTLFQPSLMEAIASPTAVRQQEVSDTFVYCLAINAISIRTPSTATTIVQSIQCIHNLQAALPLHIRKILWRIGTEMNMLVSDNLGRQFPNIIYWTYCRSMNSGNLLQAIKICCMDVCINEYIFHLSLQQSLNI